MNILGVNSGRAAPSRCDPAFRRPLADGSAAMISGSRVVCAAVEERHRRIRYAGGFARSAAVVLDEAGCKPEDVHAIGLSSCCDSPWLAAGDRLDLLIEELGAAYPGARLRSAWSGKVHLVDHHDSHAALGFIGSGWTRALVCVLDGFGNRLDDTDRFHTGQDWWRGRFERQTFFLGEWTNGRARLERVRESATGPDEIGVAEAYRAVTHYCGWPSYQYAGKTMALAGYGDWRNLERLRLISTGEEHEIQVHLANLHGDPFQQISTALHEAGYREPTELTRPAAANVPFLADLASVLQHQLESALISAVCALSDEFAVNDVVFSGGAALNCIALGKLARARPDLRLYVPPAPGDTGQGLGNAAWLACAEASPVAENEGLPKIRTASLGPTYKAERWRLAVEEFASTRRDFGVSLDLSDAELARRAACGLVDGATIGLRWGRAEYGPRALGNCSILADPRRADAQVKVNAIKRREPFRPFAASVLTEKVRACFDGPVASPFMTFAGVASEGVRRLVPGVVHVDGTTRYQTVDPGSGMMRRIIEESDRESGLPLVLNTSFNIAGEPMVETPEEALDVFERSGLDALIIGSHWIQRQ